MKYVNSLLFYSLKCSFFNLKTVARDGGGDTKSYGNSKITVPEKKFDFCVFLLKFD